MSASRLAWRLLPFALAATAVHAQDAGSPAQAGAQQAGEVTAEFQPWRWEPSVSLGETLTDNHDLSSEGQDESITTLTGRLRVVSAAGPVRGSVDYSGTGVIYARHSADNEIVHSLALSGTAEVVPGRFFIDGRASVQRQSRSLFGSQTVDPTRATDNAATVKTVALTPYVRGRLLSAVDYEVRASHEVSRTRSGDASNAENSAFLARVAREGAGVGWFGEALHDTGRFSDDPSTQDSRVRLGVTVHPEPGWRLGVTGGYETGDLDGGETRSEATWGALASWRPGPHMTLSADYEHRPFAETHGLQWQLRSGRTTWGLTAGRDVVAGNRGTLTVNLGTPTTPVVSTFLTSATSIRQSQAASMVITLPRQTLSLQLQHEETRRLNVVSSAVDDLSQSSRVTLDGASGSLSHRLTPLTTISASGAYRKARGDDATDRTELKLAALDLTTQLGRRTELGGQVRYTVSNGGTDPYRETAVNAVITHRFY